MGFLLALFNQPHGVDNDNQTFGIFFVIATFIALFTIPFYFSGFVSFVLEIVVFFLGFSLAGKLIEPEKKK
jgi:hypothetical protein